MGKNLLINALLNSLFIFNAQIEIPPAEFIKIVDSKNKNFLWGGTAKIAHHSIIGDYHEGGIKYKDLDTFVMAVNIKFLIRLKVNCNLNSTCLLRFWLMQMFQIPTECANDDQKYFHGFFNKELNILDCKIKVPRETLWKGHPFYYEILKSYEKCLDQFPKSPENILSLPLWYNKFLGTQFNLQLSKAGYNYLKDLYVDGKLLTENLTLHNNRLAASITSSLVNLINRIPLVIKNIISRNLKKSTVIFPFQTINYNGNDFKLMYMDSKEIYSALLYPKVKMPKGLLNWCGDLELSDCQIKTSLTFAHKCCTNVFDRVFQYKIVTQILPTKEYLFRYKVKDSNICDHCNIECDTIVHRLYECEKIVQTMSNVFNFLQNECNQREIITMAEYLFGKQGDKHLALNHILLECKKMIFYSTTEDLISPAFCEHFINKLRLLIIKEKRLALESNSFETFCSKWETFAAIYDFRGPDLQFH